jgi:hypothetical protein
VWLSTEQGSGVNVKGARMSQRTLKGRAFHLGLSMIVASLGSVAVYSSSGNTVRIEDRCDPATFNAVLGDGACIGDGDTTFNEFLANTQEEGGDHHWRFKEDELEVRAGSTVNATNLGGEAHTFTPVEHFGGGFIDLLNDLSGAGPIVPECVPVADADGNLVAPGPVLVFPRTTAKSKPVGGTRVQRFQCCIHPWMRTEVTIRNR